MCHSSSGDWAQDSAKTDKPITVQGGKSERRNQDRYALGPRGLYYLGSLPPPTSPSPPPLWLVPASPLPALTSSTSSTIKVPEARQAAVTSNTTEPELSTMYGSKRSAPVTDTEGSQPSAKRSNKAEIEDPEVPPKFNHFHRLPEELVIEISNMVDKPEWLSMTLVDHKLQRIVKPILWKDVEIDIGGGPTISYTRPADRPRKEWLQDLKASIGFSDEDRPKPRGVFLAHMNTFKEVLEDVVAFTHHLKLKVPLDMEEVREPYVQLAFDAIRRSKELITLDMSGTELHERWWTALNNTLNGTSEASSNLRSRLEHVGFPSLDKKTCTERVYKAIHTYRTSEWPENYLGISPMNACFEFGTKGKKTSTDRTIVVSVDGSYLPLNIPLGDVEVDLFRDTDFYHGTDMDIVQKFMHKMGFPKDRGAFHSLSARRRVIYDWEYPSYESLLQSLELGSATAPLTITNLTLEGISFSWPHDRYEEDLARIAMPQLRKLHLLECKQFDQFLQEIAQTPGMQLSTFHCMNPRRESPDEDTTYIQRFLESISGLQDLTLHATLPWALDEQSALANHMSLRRLDLRYEDKSYPVPAISNLAKLCPNLVTLGFQIDVLGQVIKFGVIKSDMRKAMKRIVKALTEFHLLDTLNIYFSVVSVKETDTTDDDTARVERFRMVAETFYQLVQKINNDSSKATAPSAIQKVTLRMRQPHFASLEKLTRLDNPHIPAWMYEPEYEQTYCHTDLGIMDSTNFAVPG